MFDLAIAFCLVSLIVAIFLCAAALLGYALEKISPGFDQHTDEALSLANDGGESWC